MNHFVAALGGELSLTSEEIADILWLAVQMGELPQPATLDMIESLDTEKSRSPRRNDSPLEQNPIKPPITNTSPPAEIHLADDRSGFGGGLAISVPDARSLREPLELARSLKPLLQRVASGWSNVLDEEATILKIDREQIWMPILKPNLEAWLDLVLVVDDSISMQIWQRTISELQRFLAHYGVFRDVRVYSLVVEDNSPEATLREQVYVRPRLGAAAEGQSLRHPRELIDPSGRRLILVATDCVSMFWRSGVVLPALKLWAKSGPLAIVQMLPEWLWGRSGLGLASAVRFGSLQAGIPNHQLKATNLALWDDVDLDLGVKVPVVTLEPEMIKIWAQLVAGKGGIQSPGFVFDLEPSAGEEQRQTEFTGEERVRRFQVTASPLARQLAMILAAAPTISLPIVRILQDRLLPRSQQVHVAEVFLGGLLKPLVEVDTRSNPDLVPYEFMDGARNVLLDSVPTTKVVNVLTEVSQFVAERLGLTLDAFMGVLRTPQETGDQNIVNHSRPFAMMTAQILRKLGGGYAQLAQELEQANRQDPLKIDGRIDHQSSEVWNCVRSFSGHDDNVTCVAFSPDGQFIVSSSDDKTVRLWDVKEGRELWRHRGHNGMVHCIAFSPDGQLIASASEDKTVNLLNLQGNLIRTLTGHIDSVKSVAFSPDGRLIASGCSDSAVKIWNLSGEEIKSVRLIRQHISIETIIFSVDCEWIIFGTSEGSIFKDSVRQKSTIQSYPIHDNTINSLVLHPNGSLLASGSRNATVRLSDLDGKQLGNPFIGHESIVWSVAFSPDGELVASGSRDKTIRLWDLEGNPVGNPLIGHESGVNGVAFSPSSKMLVSCGADRKIKFWSKYRNHQLPFRKLSDFAVSYLLNSCNNTDVNYLQTTSPWRMPFDALVIPVDPKGTIGTFGDSFDCYLNSIAILQANSFQLFIKNKMQELKIEKIDPANPLIFSLPSDISSILFFSYKPVFIICITVVFDTAPSVDSAGIATKALINIAARHGCKNLILPLLGAGGFQLPVDEVTRVMLRSIDSTLKSLDNNEIEEITIIEKDPVSTEIIERIGTQLFDNIALTNNSESVNRPIQPPLVKDEPLVDLSLMYKQSNNLMPCAVVLTALSVEYLAVRAYLTNLKEEIHTNGTIYERGEFAADCQTWSVGIVEIGAGNSGAALEVERAIGYFNPEVILFVGVAGGIKDVKIGDVVASTKVYAYESGKAEITFEARPEIGLASYALEQRARAEARKSDWLHRIPKTEIRPTVFVAPIAAGEKVITSTKSEIYQFLRSNYSDAVAVEMEGFGVLKAANANQQVSAMVIRGISDLIDDKNQSDDKGFQEIASSHASAFAFEVLAKFKPENKVGSKDSQPEITAESQEIIMAAFEDNKKTINVRVFGNVGGSVFMIRANNINFGGNSQESLTKYQFAIEQLLERKLIEIKTESSNNNIYKLSLQGYEYCNKQRGLD